MACNMVYKLWECMVHMDATGIIISPELNLWKKIWEAMYLSNKVCSRGCQESAAKEETYPLKTGNVDGSVKNHFALLDCCINHSCSL